MTTRLRELSAELRTLEDRLRLGGGVDKIEKQHQQGKLTARERVVGVCDVGSRFIEIGLLLAYDQYDGAAPAAGVITGVGIVHGRPVVVVANDATVKAGSWWPETIRKMLRAQEVAMRCRIPIIYLVDSAGADWLRRSGERPSACNPATPQTGRLLVKGDERPDDARPASGARQPTLGLLLEWLQTHPQLTATSDHTQ